MHPMNWSSHSDILAMVMSNGVDGLNPLNPLNGQTRETCVFSQLYNAAGLESFALRV